MKYKSRQKISQNIRQKKSRKTRSAVLHVLDQPSAMEPMLPSMGNRRLEDLAITLVAKANGFATLLHPIVQTSVGELVRSMNCYYSNLIEGHDTHPRDIERALAQDFSKQARQRDLQLEAKAHIEVQSLIDQNAVPENFISEEYIRWLHQEFCQRLPQDMLWAEDPDTKKRARVLPGKLRRQSVVVGRHIPPSKNLAQFLARFTEAYQTGRLSKLQQVVAVAASHHRLLWIHPFLDGNGRVTRLFSHAYLKHLNLGSELWSISRALARRAGEYKAQVEAADERRRGDLDGRGNLSAQALVDFCEFFFEICMDQIEYMSSLLEPEQLLIRIRLYCEEEERAGRLHKKSFQLLREALLAGQFDRGHAGEISGYSNRQGQRILSKLEDKKLLVSTTPKGPVRLAFPVDVVERWFPRLYPI